jgi:hypothetical protein
MTIRSAHLAFMCLLVAAMIPACSTIRVQQEAAPGVDFSSYKVFTQAPPPKTADASLPGYSEIAGSHIQMAIGHAMESKGLTSAPEGKADLIVVFSIDGQPRQDIESDGGYGGWYGGWGGSGNSYSVNSVTGTLTIDVFDVEQKKLIWHAYGQTDIYGQPGSSGSDKVDDAVKQILKQYPSNTAP